MVWKKNLSMNDKIILTDIDGVVLNWESHFHTWMANRGYNLSKSGTYHINETYNISYQKSRELIYDFNTSAYMIDIPPFRDAISGIAKLKENGYKFIAITSVGDDYNTKRLRSINLSDYFGRNTFIEITCIGEGKSKQPYLEKYKDCGFYWIEDLPKNALYGLNVGLKSLLMKHSYNNDFNDAGIIKVDNWAQICQIILE
jgi:FMN phosphatase YigB (HAD superfamily)